ncbi:MAG: hypothetical protein MJZ06_10165 [Bacteroidaceae bacterium]|nr:hypothetical protein [Bacteroidaceae bacterium]
MSDFFRQKGLAAMAVCVMGAFFAASCTSDEFYGIEEEADAVAFSTLTKIANSAEYLEYQEQAFLAQQAIASIDTTKKVQVCEIDGKPIYGSESVSIQGALDARQKLVEAYPEFEKTTAAERNQILNIAMMNNKSLRSIAPTSAINMTKGSWYETEASRYALSNYESCIHASPNYTGGYGMFMSTWYVEDNYLSAVAMAVSESEWSGHLAGGFEFEDGSGIYVEDYRASSSLTYLITYDQYTTLKPKAAFVAIPSTNHLQAAYESAGGVNTWMKPYIGVAIGSDYGYWYPQK